VQPSSKISFEKDRLIFSGLHSLIPISEYFLNNLIFNGWCQCSVCFFFSNEAYTKCVTGFASSQLFSDYSNICGQGCIATLGEEPD
jgi:hypothetical protein